MEGTTGREGADCPWRHGSPHRKVLCGDATLQALDEVATKLPCDLENQRSREYQEQ